MNEMKTITITDVANHAKVSKSTVSQYLNKRYEYMSEKTRKKIEETIEELNYQPNIKVHFYRWSSGCQYPSHVFNASY
jgi:DNA-binding LacI/PurR family transcriptional regulator